MESRPDALSSINSRDNSMRSSSSSTSTVTATIDHGSEILSEDAAMSISQGGKTTEMASIPTPQTSYMSTESCQPLPEKVRRSSQTAEQSQTSCVSMASEQHSKPDTSPENELMKYRTRTSIASTSSSSSGETTNSNVLAHLTKQERKASQAKAELIRTNKGRRKDKGKITLEKLPACSGYPG